MNNVVTFPSPDDFARRNRTVRAARVLEAEADSSDLSITCRNSRLRDARKDDWRNAEARRRYWRAFLDFESAISYARNRGVKEATLHPEPTAQDRDMILAAWRDSLVIQMLTPAPDVAAVAWKRRQIGEAQWRFMYVAEKHIMDVEKRIHAAIEADVAWLEAHPTKKSIAASRQAKKGG